MLSAAEQKQVDAANGSSKPTVVFIHGLWLLASSWDAWRELFESSGYATVAAEWPDDPPNVEQARAHPEVFAGKGIKQVADHHDGLVRALTRKPAVVGHSFGGLMTQIVAGRGLAAVSVAIDPAPFRGVLPLPISALRSAMPVLLNPLNRGRAVSLNEKQFRYGWANELSDQDGRALREKFHVAGPGKPIFQAALANLNPWTEAKVDTKHPERGPLLIIEGESDHTVPWSLANAAFKRQSRNSAQTEIKKIPGRGHSLTIDSGWREVADPALAFIQRFLPATTG
jgi:non-heme chloroperoxidase